MRMPFSGSVILYPQSTVYRDKHAIHFMQPAILRNFVTQVGHSVQSAVPSGKQAGPLFKKCLNYLILMDPYILVDSVEIPTRCSFVTEFIIPKFIEGSTCFERHTAHHQELSGK